MAAPPPPYAGYPPPEPPLHLVTLTSPADAEIFDGWFLRTLEPARHDIALHARALEPSEAAPRPGAWTAAGTEHLLSVMRARPDGEYVCFACAPAQFLHPAELRDLVRRADAADLDLFCAEDGDLPGAYDGGFFLARNGPAARSFFESIAPGDAAVFDQLVRARPGLRHDFVPRDRAVYAAAVAPGVRPVFHRATGVTGAAEAAAQMRAVRALLRERGIPVSSPDPSADAP